MPVPNAEQTCSIFSRFIFSYMGPVIWAGYRTEHLEVEDMPPLMDTDYSKNLVKNAFPVSAVYALQVHLTWLTLPHTSISIHTRAPNGAIFSLASCVSFVSNLLPLGVYISSLTKWMEYRCWIFFHGDSAGRCQRSQLFVASRYLSYSEVALLCTTDFALPWRFS